MKNELKNHIDSLIENNHVVLFMKGTKDRPQCGFSKQVVEALRNLTDFVSVDVLSDPDLRDGIKVYSNWPTIPQLYINKEFIGGCDIVLDMYRSHELHKLLNLQRAHQKPAINISHAAIAALKNAKLDCHDGEDIRISVGIDFEHGLSFDRKNDGDFSLQFGELELLIDPYSALRAENLSIDYVTDNLDAGFLFNNPNEPPAVKELSVEELKAWHEQGKHALLIDVRPQFEWDMAHISFAKPVSEITENTLDKNQPIVFHCHHGGRSKRVAESFRLKGFTNLYNLTGGIDAWSKRIDPSVPVYTK